MLSEDLLQTLVDKRRNRWIDYDVFDIPPPPHPTKKLHLEKGTRIFGKYGACLSILHLHIEPCSNSQWHYPTDASSKEQGEIVLMSGEHESIIYRLQRQEILLLHGEFRSAGFLWGTWEGWTHPVPLALTTILVREGYSKASPCRLLGWLISKLSYGLICYAHIQLAHWQLLSSGNLKLRT